MPSDRGAECATLGQWFKIDEHGRISYVFGDKVSGEPVNVRWHLVDGEPDGVHRPVDGGARAAAAAAAATGATSESLLLAQKVKSVASFVVLRHRDDHVALGAGGGRSRDLDEELRVHGRRLCRFQTIVKNQADAIGYLIERIGGGAAREESLIDPLLYVRHT